MVFDPLKSPPEDPVAGSPADDLADIWFDVKRGLLIFEAKGEAALADVQWSWKFSFETHWGRHATGAMAAPGTLVPVAAKSPADGCYGT